MSKEFVPGVGLMITSKTPISPSRDNNNYTADVMSPSMEQFKHIDPKNIPYWSPATKLNSKEKNNTTTASLNSNLVASAQEFVPSLTSSSSNFIPNSNVSGRNEFNVGHDDSYFPQPGMNSAASEWRPPSVGLQETQMKTPSPELPIYHTETIEADPLVEVEWNGSVYLVPASMAFGVSELTQQQQQRVHPPSSFDGMEWSMYMSSVPAPRKRSLQTIGIPEPIRQHFQNLDIDALRQMSPDDDRYKEIPARYHSAYPLDDPVVHRAGTGGSFGYPSSLYKVVDNSDSQLYTLRRFDNVRQITPSVLSNAQSKWIAIRHPSVVSLYSISMEKGAVFFAHAYHPSAQTLQQRFLNPKTISSTAPVSESLLWRLLSQLLAGIRHVHARGMALRSISPSHILLTSGARFRIANVGVVDVLEFESRKALIDMQLEDLFRLGCVVLSVAARSQITLKSIEAGMNLLQQNYSSDLYQVLGTLFSGSRSAEQLCHVMFDKMCDELDFSLASNDALHLNLQNEYENGRLLRLLLKLGCINERPEHALHPSWSETGDRYVLKLFRDYLFHQTDSDGTPQLDMGHIISSLNKLDVGDREQILLSSRDGKNILVASFYDINRCIEMAFTDLSQQASRSVQQSQVTSLSQAPPLPPLQPPPLQPQYSGYPPRDTRGGVAGRGTGRDGGMYSPRGMTSGPNKMSNQNQGGGGLSMQMSNQQQFAPQVIRSGGGKGGSGVYGRAPSSSLDTSASYHQYANSNMPPYNQPHGPY